MTPTLRRESNPCFLRKPPCGEAESLGAELRQLIGCPGLIEHARLPPCVTRILGVTILVPGDSQAKERLA
jgi:hypothetical protein